MNAAEVTDALSFNKFFIEYLKLLEKSYFAKHAIEIVLIIDEANYFFSLFRLYKKCLFLKGAKPLTNDGK